MPNQEQIQEFANDFALTPYCNGNEQRFLECVSNRRDMQKVFEYFLDYDDMHAKWWDIVIPDLSGLPLGVANMAFLRAHSDGHANGYREVASRMIEEFNYVRQLITMVKK